MIVSSIGEHSPRTGQLGLVRVYSGKDASILLTLEAPMRISGEFGRFVAGVGDWNQDGTVDVLVAERARIYVFSGRIPSSRVLLGVELALQSAHGPTLGPLGFDLSNGLHWRLGT